ncbi:MAG TPA: hypothetical protein VKH43_13025 [Thermoanaerobaculia bacterium]|nr:hypothetical protein [Thermoanaerobaculia bacterium]
MKLRAIGLICLAVLAPMPAAAQKKAPARAKVTATPSPEPTAVPTPSPIPMSAACSGEKYRQFDFWLGEWDLVGGDGKKSADDKIVMVLGGCGVQENWTGTKGGQGLSFSAYDPATRRWHQTLMDDGGAVLNLEGEFADGKMILVGTRPSQREKGVTITHRIAWTPQPNHSVKQVWENSTNGGRTWRLVSEGTYVKKGT